MVVWTGNFLLVFAPIKDYQLREGALPDEPIIENVKDAVQDQGFSIDGLGYDTFASYG